MDRPSYVYPFINRYLPCARSVELFFRIPVSVTLAYAAADSDWGRSFLAKKEIIFGQPWSQVNATDSASIAVIQVSNRRKVVKYFKRTTAREAFLAFGERLQNNPLFQDALRFVDNPEKFLEVIAAGSLSQLETDQAQLARTSLREQRLKEFDSWLYEDSLVH